MNNLPKFSRESKAIVFPAGTVAGYGHIQSLGLAGIPVVAANPDKCDSFYSRYVVERHIVPDPLKDHEAFVQWLVEYGKNQESKPVLFMAEDVFAYIVSLYQAELSPVCLYPYLPLDKLDRFFNKEHMLRFAEQAGVPLPLTLTNPTRNQLLEWDAFPAIIKPLVARFTFRGRKLINTGRFQHLFGSKAAKVNNRQELLEKAAMVEEAEIAYFVQEYLYVPNRELPTIKFVAAEDHSIPAVFIGRKVRQWPADFGTCTVGESDYIPEIYSLTERFLKAIEYVGPGGIEFIWNKKEGKWQFIELNPRLDFWIGMAALKGVNLPLQQYLLSTGQHLFAARQRDGGRYWIDIIGDWEDWKWRRNNPEWKVSLWERLKPYFYFNEAVFSWKDPIPGARRLARPIVRRFLRPLKAVIQCARYISRKAPIDPMPTYNDYWNRRIEDGSSRAFYPRFEIAANMIRPTDNILDYGCGSGEFLRYLKSKGYKNIAGCDVCKPADFPREIPFFNENELFRNMHFDVVTMLQVIEHIPDAEDAIAKMFTISNKIVVSIPNCGYWQHRLRLLFGRVPITDVLYHMKEHVRLWTHKDFMDICQSFGWKVRFARAAVPQNSILARFFPGLFARQMIYLLDKNED